MLEFKQLRYFVAIAESSSFSKAAQKLFITQPALSQQISKLEEQLGIKLLERNTRSVQLTAAGWDLYHRSMQLLRDMENMINSVLSTDSLGFLSETIHIAIDDNIFSLRNTGAYEFLDRLRSQRKDLTIECVPATFSAIPQFITDGTCDMAIAYLTGPSTLSPNLTEHCIHRGHLAFAVPKDWSTDFFSPEFKDAINRANLLYPTHRSYWHGIVNSLMSKYDLFTHATPISSYESACNYTLSGNGLFFAPEVQLRNQDNTYFNIVSIPDPLAEYRVSVITAMQNHSILLQQIMELLPNEPVEAPQ